MKQPKLLALPGYLVALLLIGIPLVEIALPMLPTRFGEVQWRFGAAGLFSRAMMTPFLGLFIVFAIALLLDQRAVLRTISVGGVLLAVLLLGAFAIFALDALQVRVQIKPEARRAFDTGAIFALMKFALGSVTAVVFASSARRALARQRSKQQDTAPTLTSRGSLKVGPATAPDTLGGPN
jgi:hypothetical protein